MQAAATLTQPLHGRVNQTQVTLLRDDLVLLSVDAVTLSAKPVDPEEMLQLVRKLMAGGKA